MAMIKIYTSSNTSGVDLTGRYVPKSFQVDVSDLDSDKTTRSVSGILNRDRIRARVHQLELEWGYLTRTEMSTLISYFNADSAFTASDGTSVPKGFIYVEFPSPFSSNSVKKVMYASDRSTPLFNFNMGMWEGLKLNLIER